MCVEEREQMMRHDDRWKESGRKSAEVSSSTRETRAAPLYSHDTEVDGDEHQNRLCSEHDERTSKCARGEGLDRKVGALEVGVKLLVRLGILLAQLLGASGEYCGRSDSESTYALSDRRSGRERTFRVVGLREEDGDERETQQRPDAHHPENPPPAQATH